MTPFVAGALLALGGSPLASLAVKATIVLVAVLVAARLAARGRAAVRHAVLASGFAALLALPATSYLMPPVPLGVPVARAMPVAEAPASAMSIAAVESASAAAVPGAAGQAAPLRRPAAVGIVQAVWAAGMLLCLLPVAAGMWRSRSLRRAGVRWSEGCGVARRLAAEAGLARSIDVLLHESVRGPASFGAVRHVILLPHDAPEWKPEDLRRALVHELEHVRRADWTTQCLARVVRAAYWFHPLVWIAWRQLVLEAERACDDAVLRRSEPVSYADQLVALASRLSMAPSLPVLGMAARTDLATRVRAVLDPGQARGPAGVRSVATVAAAAAVLVAALAPIRTIAAPRLAPGTNDVASGAVQSLPAVPDGGDPRTAKPVSQPLDPVVRRRAAEGHRLQSETAGSRPSQEADASMPDSALALTVLLVDHASVPPELMRRLPAFMQTLVDGLHASNRLAVVGVDTQVNVLADFTADRDTVMAALQSLETAGAIVSASVPGSLAASLASLDPTAVAALDAIASTRLRGVAALCHALAPLAQRKRILFLAAGLSRQEEPGHADLRAATSTCARTNTAIYPVDARGLRDVVPSQAGGGSLFSGGQAR